ncbi:MAG: hypothetical protein PHN55_13980 [Dysgonamonadaceae bacterium]|nr:hypothetical protein [Dysgonamonadaceae bacterium]
MLKEGRKVDASAESGGVEYLQILKYDERKRSCMGLYGYTKGDAKIDNFLKLCKERTDKEISTLHGTVYAFKAELDNTIEELN